MREEQTLEHRNAHDSEGRQSLYLRSHPPPERVAARIFHPDAAPSPRILHIVRKLLVFGSIAEHLRSRIPRHRQAIGGRHIHDTKLARIGSWSKAYRAACGKWMHRGTTRFKGVNKDALACAGWFSERDDGMRV